MSTDRDKAVNLPPQSVSFEELLEVVTRAVGKLNIEWPADKEHQERPKSKLDKRFLCSRSPPPCRGLPFSPDLHTEISRSWDKPYASRLFNPDILNYSSVLGLNEHGYGKIPWVEGMLASYLSPRGASSLKAPVLPTKPVYKFLSSRSPKTERCHSCPSPEKAGGGAALQVEVYGSDGSEDHHFQ